MKFIKKMKLSTVAVIALGNIAFAGGEFSPVSEYEVKDEIKAAEVKVEKVVEKKMTSSKKGEEVKEKSPWYVGVGLASGQVQLGSREDKTYGPMAKVGYELSKYLSAEVRGFRTNWDYEGGKIKHYGAFLKPQYPINEELNFYGLVGYAKTSLENQRIFSDTGLAYGAGLEYAMSEKYSLFIDYERLLHDAGVYDLDALTLGLSYGF